MHGKKKERMEIVEFLKTADWNEARSVWPNSATSQWKGNHSQKVTRSDFVFWKHD